MIKSLTLPELLHGCNSWIIVKDGNPVMETWNRELVKAIADDPAQGIEIYTALSWLQHFNASVVKNA